MLGAAAQPAWPEHNSEPDRAQIRRTGVYALLDWHNLLLSRVTCLSKERLDKNSWAVLAGSKALEPTVSLMRRTVDQCYAVYDMFRHKRRMELVELSGRTTGRLGYTWLTRASAIGGTATLALRYSIISATTAARTRPQ